MSAGDGDKVQVCPLCLFARIRSTHHTSWKILQNISFSENKISPSITVGTIDVWRRRRHLQLCMRQKQKANEWYTSRPKNIPRHLGKDGHFSSFAWFPAFVANAMVLLSPSGDLGISLVWHNLSGPHRDFSVWVLKSSSNWTKLSMRGPQLFSGWYQMIFRLGSD